MRYGPEQAEKTKARVVKIAAQQMRKRGPDGVGVADVMKRAGLTHGGFYAHFESKDDLIAAAVRQMFAEAREMFRGATEGKDRKSTRLNSSHVEISYAVFCLKKKKKKKKEDRKDWEW